MNACSDEATNPDRLAMIEAGFVNDCRGDQVIHGIATNLMIMHDRGAAPIEDWAVYTRDSVPVGMHFGPIEKNELARAAGMRAPSEQDIFACAKRIIPAEYRSLQSQASCFERKQYGKPLLRAEQDLHIHGGHAGAYWPLKVLSTGLAGIDIEKVRLGFD